MTERNRLDLLQENERLRALAARLETERKRLEDDLLQIEQQNTNLASLFVASHRLHSTLDRAEVLAGIQEIIVNLVGSEEIIVCEVGDDHRQPRLTAAVGIEARSFDDLPLESQRRIDECLRSRQVWVRRPENDGAPLNACIPMIVNDRATGAIAIFRLLQQKNGLEDVDHELFGLLATHAATALYCATLHAGTEVM
jgi:nitrate/nitrite-specific signal transduction histidine kinase